ncbi:MAG: Ig-like domain-containing protein, partial [Acidimicrobiia bacterium]
ITGTIAPARTAVTAAGLAAASLVPGVLAPAHVPAPMESTFVAAGVADAAESSPPTTVPFRRGTRTEASTRATATSTPSGAPAPVDAALPGTAPANAGEPVAGATTPSGSGGGGTSGGGGGTSGLGGGGSTTTTTTSTTTTSTTQPPAHAPVAINDAPAPILLNSHVVIDVLANDSDVDGNIDPATLRIVSRSAGAAAQQITVIGGRIDIVAKTLVVGPMSFVYEICDSTSLCATAKVTITIVAAL